MNAPTAISRAMRTQIGRAKALGSELCVLRKNLDRVSWARLDSNQRPIGYEPTALTAELQALRIYITRTERAVGCIHSQGQKLGWATALPSPTLDLPSLAASLVEDAPIGERTPWECSILG